MKSTFQVGLKPLTRSLCTALALSVALVGIALGSVSAQEISESDRETVMDVMASIDNEVNEAVMSGMAEATAVASGSFSGLTSTKQRGR